MRELLLTIRDVLIDAGLAPPTRGYHMDLEAESLELYAAEIESCVERIRSKAGHRQPWGISDAQGECEAVMLAAADACKGVAQRLRRGEQVGAEGFLYTMLESAFCPPAEH